MGEDQVTITLPISGHAFGVIITVLGVALLSIFVFWATGKAKRKDWLSTLRQRLGLTGLHQVLVVFFIILWAALFVALLTGVFWVLFAIGERMSVSSEEEGRDLRWYLLTLTAVTAALGAVIALPFTLIKTALNSRQTETAEQGLITDRINKAVEGLGAIKETNRIGRSVEILEISPDFEPDDSVDAERLKNPPKRTEIQWQGEASPAQNTETQGKVGQWEVFTASEPNLEVRIGSIYALERISQDSARDHIQIMEILCAYIRENARTEDLTPRETPFETGALRVDLQAAIDVIGRRSEARRTIEAQQKYRLDLRNTDLSFADFSKGFFAAAILANCRLEACNFRDANLAGALLHNSVLNFSEFFRCKLIGAKLDFSVINRPKVKMGGWVSSINMGELRGVSFPGADLSALVHIGNTNIMNQTMGSRDTILSPSLTLNMPSWDVLENNIYRGMPDLDENTLTALEQIENAGFKYWFPFDAKRDMAFGPQRAIFLRAMGLDVWPYREE